MQMNHQRRRHHFRAYFITKVDINKTLTSRVDSSKWEVSTFTIFLSSFSSFTLFCHFSKAHQTTRPRRHTSIELGEQHPGLVLSFSSTKNTQNKQKTQNTKENQRWKSIDNFCCNYSKNANTWRTKRGIFRCMPTSIERVHKGKAT